jgi:ribonucleotide reductase alpha subunit
MNNNIALTDDDLWWLNEESKQVLNRGYLLRGETVIDAITRVCESAAKYYDNTKWSDSAYDKFYELVTKGWMSLSSPIWSNMGTKRGLPISCFGVYVDDTIESITSKQGEVQMQTKLGGGTSGYFGALRARGSSITDNGKSSGPVSFMKLFDTAMDVISQGGVRRGSFAAYLDIDHPDVKEFLQIKDIGNPIQNLFYAVCVPDYWMQEMIDGDQSKREIWAKVLESRQKKGLPYILFSDNVNRNKPEIYKELDLTIHASNLCFTGDTLVAVADGRNAVKIKDLAIESNGIIKFPVYSAKNRNKLKIPKKNGGFIIQDAWQTEIKNAIAFKTGTKKVIEVVLSNGDTFKCTEEHRLALHNGDYVEANKSIGCELASFFTYTALDRKGLYVVDIIDNNEIEDVYDLTVEDNHNFYIITSTDDEQYNNCNGILVHNCSEIALPSNIDESFVCCLSSMNLELYDEWKDTDAVYYATLFLDAVMSEFIDKTANIKYFREAHNFAKRHRALGLGVMGYHSYMQKHMIEFESWEAKQFNVEVFKHLKTQTYTASNDIGNSLGFAPIFYEASYVDNSAARRNTTTLAIAPTTSSSAILGQVSPGIEPYSSNYYKAGLAKGNFIRKNKYLAALLESKNMNNEDIWRDIMLKHGSVQHLDCLTDKEKNVFKTFKELSQAEIITQAAQRQQFIDQSQSLNVNIPAEVPIQEVNRLFINAWQSGVKTLYYQRSQSISKELLSNIVNCVSCES